MPVQELCTVIKQEQLTDSIFSLTLSAPKICELANAGQFVHISCGEARLLRRPISICDTTEDTLRVVFTVKGEGTAWLSERKKGDELDVLGPAGHGFDLSVLGDKPVFIGGGSGIGYLLMPYGGYTMVYPFVGLLLPLLCGKKYNRIRYTLVAVFGALLIDAIGMFRLMAVNGLDLQAGLLTGFFPFLPLDLVKCVIAAQIIPQFRKVLQ